MDLDVIEGMKDIKYPIDEIGIRKAVDEWPVSVEYTKLVEYLTKELQHFCDLDEHVNSISCIDDSKSFLLEISSFLKELGCPYRCLTEGNVSDRLKTCEDRYKLLDFLITELLAARIISVKNPKEKNLEVTLNESATAGSLKKMLMALKISKPPSNVTAPMMFAKVQSKVKELSSNCISEPLFSGQLSEKQWITLAEVNQELLEEYKVRRQLLIKRLDVTIQSFQWSERMKGREKEISGLFGERRQMLEDQPAVRLSDMLAARAHIAIIEKTSNSNVRKNTQSSINKVIIGKVPDRGGRPSGQQPPPPEMPSWAPRASQPISQPQGGGERPVGGRGTTISDRGGRIQGGWRAEEKSVNHSRGRGHPGSGYQGRGVGHAGGGVGHSGGVGHPGGVVGPGVGHPGVGVAHPCVGVGPSVGHPCVGHPGHPTGVGHPCVGHPGASFHGFQVPRNYPSGGTYQNLAFQGGNVYQPSGFYPAGSGPAGGFQGVTGYQNVGYQGNTRYSVAVGYHQGTVSYHGGGVGAGTVRGRGRGRGRGADIKHTY